jgi:transcriptional regulator with PAS, ATPase and Fis domain
MHELGMLAPEVIIRNRLFFIEHGRTIDNEIPNKIPEIYESWARSRAFGVNAALTRLPLPSKNVTTHIDSYRSSINGRLTEYIKQVASDSKIVRLILDEDLTVFLMDGNEKLLQILNSLNICVGASLAEQSSGTNAAVLAMCRKEISCVIGAQHYIEALQDYVSCAIPGRRDDGTVDYLMFITYKDNFHPSMKGLLYYHERSHNLNFAYEQKKMECSMSEKCLKEAKQEFLYLDPRGIILNVSDGLAHSLSLDRAELIGTGFSTFFPELSEAFLAVQSGKEMSLQVVLKDSAAKNGFLASIQAVSSDTRHNAVIITFVPKQSKYIAETVGHRARYTFADLAGNSKRFRETMFLAQKAAESCSNVLLEGETGTGKELFAQAIHNASMRSNEPFISINCAAIPRELIGSELFGYAEGAFTGARRGGATGKFEMAHKGTIFLDEISEMPHDLQAVLLRVLEERRVTRLGGAHSIPVDVRIIAATNRDIQALAASGQFRMDLYYRLNVINIDIPPLRKRLDDIPVLVEHILKRYSYTSGKNVIGVTPEVMNFFQSFSWPGNVRELRNVVERGMNFCTSLITMEDLPKKLMESYSAEPEATHNEYLEQEYDHYEKQLLWKLMKEYRGNKSSIAQKLGISRPTLYNKLKKYKIIAQ